LSSQEDRFTVEIWKDFAQRVAQEMGGVFAQLTEIIFKGLGSKWL